MFWRSFAPNTIITKGAKQARKPVLEAMIDPCLRRGGFSFTALSTHKPFLRRQASRAVAVSGAIVAIQVFL